MWHTRLFMLLDLLRLHQPEIPLINFQIKGKPLEELALFALMHFERPAS